MPKIIQSELDLLIPKEIVMINCHVTLKAIRVLFFVVRLKTIKIDEVNTRICQSIVNSTAEIEQAWEYAIAGARRDTQKIIVKEFIDFEIEITLMTV